MKKACAMFHTCETGFNDGNPPQKKEYASGIRTHERCQKKEIVTKQSRSNSVKQPFGVRAPSSPFTLPRFLFEKTSFQIGART
jgi:hypothetical protein